MQKTSHRTATAKIISIPCAVEAQCLSRRILMRADATPEEVGLALITLEGSTDWRDLNLAQRTREAMRANARILAAERSMHAERQLDQAPLTFPTPQEGKPDGMKLAAGLVLAAALAWAIGTAAAVSIQNSTAQAAVWRSTH